MPTATMPERETIDAVFITTVREHSVMVLGNCCVFYRRGESYRPSAKQGALVGNQEERNTRFVG